MSVVAALALTATAPALAADMPVKAAKPAAPAAAPSPWDVAFGTAFTTDYDLRGVSQSNHKPAAQGYFEVDYTATDWLKLYAGVWGSSLWTGFADAEFDITGGARFTCGNFGLDLGLSTITIRAAITRPLASSTAAGSKATPSRRTSLPIG